jgi:hypothetical protein
MNEEQNNNEQLNPAFLQGAVISSVSNSIKDGSIVWIKLNNEVNCGQVRKVYTDDKQALIHNFDAWSDWLVDFDKIIRIGVSYYTDDYREYVSRQHCL